MHTVQCSMFYVHWIWSRYILGSSKSPPFWRKSQECEKPTSFLRTIQSINCSSLSLLFFQQKRSHIDNGTDNKWRHSYWIDTWLNSSADVRGGYYIIGFHRYFSLPIINIYIHSKQIIYLCRASFSSQHTFVKSWVNCMAQKWCAWFCAHLKG